jgi:polyribonucleotide nucleotidyltransferase
MKKFKVTTQVGGQDLILETGKFAGLTNAAVLVTYGETVVHVTACMADSDTNLPYFPLSVEFAEKLYAGGKIKGSRWVKRDGRPRDDAILKGRIIDRSIRPLFPKHVKRDVQIVTTILSADSANDADMPALVGASAALSISDIPWDGPIAGVRVGLKDGQYLVNPTYEDRETSRLDLIVSGSRDAIVMVEAGASEVTEEETLEGMKVAHTEIKNLVGAIDKLVQEVGVKKQEFPLPEPVDATLVKEIESAVTKDIETRLGKQGVDKSFVHDLAEALFDKYEDKLEPGQVESVVENAFTRLAREKTIQDEIRVDGRKLNQIRDLEAEVDLLPRTHGSAMFRRGETQVLSVTTLGSPALGQIIESMEDETTKRYIHHYNAPPYSYGDPGRFGFPGRREIGHGALAERALEPMLPEEVDFPYTIHVVSEVMSSNGSTSQASVCGSTMSLMSAGVPLKKPVAGIAMGLMTDGKKFVVLTDIQGLEDHIGDMDFKVAGTKEGITALQMDIKVAGISFEVLERALAQAKDARLEIMEVMLKAIDKPRETISQYAPKIEQFEIPADKIGEVIGPSGKMIKAIMAETGAEIDISDDTGVGVVNVSSPDQEAIDKAVGWIKGIVHVPERGEEYDGTVTRVEGYGCFVEFLPGKQGLVHVSRMSKDYVQDASSVVKVGDSVHVFVKGVDDQGRVDLSMVPLDQLRPDAPRGGNGGGRPSRRDFNDHRGSRPPRRDSRPPRR